MIKVNEDMTKAEIVAVIKAHKNDIPAFADIDTDVKKADLIEAVNAALADYTDAITSVDAPGEIKTGLDVKDEVPLRLDDGLPVSDARIIEEVEMPRPLKRRTGPADRFQR